VRVLAIDPGGHSGLAWFESGLSYEFTTRCVLISEVMGYVNSWHDVVVIEPFATAGMLSRYGLETIDLVGQVKGWCLAKNIPVVLQRPQSRRAWQDKAEAYIVANKTSLSQPPLVGPNFIVHEEDALAHLMQYLERNGIRSF
jgi:hypothetical protein